MTTTPNEQFSIFQPPQFIFSVGEMARKLLPILRAKHSLSKRKHREAFCIACLDFKLKNGECSDAHDKNNDDRFQEFWEKEYPHTEILTKQVIMTDLEHIERVWEIKELIDNVRVIEHLHVLGLCDQQVTGPLWRLAEGCDHIFETCKYALQLHVWLEECAAHSFIFFEGNSPTPNLEMNSSTNSSLLLQELVGKVSTEMGAEVVSILSRASIDYFSQAFVDFIPGGKYCNDANEVRGSSSSAPATNRNIESVFGLMSHFFDTKPNMRLDVKVAYTLLKKNHTLEWLRTLPEEDQDKILTDSRAALKMMKNASKERQIQIENDILHQMKLKNQNATKKEAKLLSDRTNATHEVLRTYNKNQLIVLNHHEYIGKKFEEMLTNRRRSSTSLKRGFVQDIRLSGRQKIVSLKYEDDEDTFERELSIFEKELSNGIVIFIN
uniref:Uncharacterized protein n=1 Tax=Caenorhabditis japonica TaxID=281687 RepID=A0A8R1E8G5_CAEJA